MTEWVLLVVAFAAGAAAAWLFARARAAGAEARETEIRQQLASAKDEIKDLGGRLSEAEKAKTAAETQRAVLEEARDKLTETFRSLAAQVLAGSNQEFLVLAEEKFRGLKNETTGDLRALVQPLSEALAAYQKETNREMGSVGNELRKLAETHTALQGETAKLANALRSPQIRGRWGEMTLRRTAEMAGMSVHCDFVEQETSGDGRLRPDMIVKLPAGRQIVVDAKAPLDGFLDAMEALTEEAREAALARYSGQVNRHIAGLASKDYWEQFPQAPEFVVLFIPTDSFLAAAAERDPSLLESALAKRIILATPSTFIALLLAVAYGWRQEKLADNAQRVSDLGQELYDRMATLADHLGKIGGALGKAVESYNAAVGSWETRVFPSARRFKELGAGGKKEFEELQPVDQTARPLIVPEEDSELFKQPHEVL